MADSIIVVGGGAFGLSSALELRSRGYAVTLLDSGPLPHPDAASTDISKVIRMDYGADESYMQLMEACLARWRAWNEDFDEIVFHETGVLYLAGGEMQPGGYAYESLQLLQKRGHPAENLTSSEIARRFPAWNTERYPTGYYNPQGGWSPSGRVVALLAGRARNAGVTLIENAAFAGLLEKGGQITGVRTLGGDSYQAEWVLVAAGTWTPHLLPWLKKFMWSVAQPVLHFQPDNPQRYQAPQFPVWTADIARSGWYGFPAQEDGTLKIANHGPGWRKDPSAPRAVPPEAEANFRSFLAASLPGLVGVSKIGERLCFYSDTFDTDFWIARDPERPGLVVSTGGSGHAFKFTPMLGPITADVLEGKANPYAARFAWRARGEFKHESARHAEHP